MYNDLSSLCDYYNYFSIFKVCDVVMPTSTIHMYSMKYKDKFDKKKIGNEINCFQRHTLRRFTLEIALFPKF